MGKAENILGFGRNDKRSNKGVAFFSNFDTYLCGCIHRLLLKIKKLAKDRLVDAPSQPTATSTGA